MLGLALALAVAAPDLRAVDDANLALTTCLFGVMRAHAGTRPSPARLSAALAAGCTAETARLRREAIAVDVARGRSRSASATSIDALLASVRAHMVSEYVRFSALDQLEPR